MRNISLCMIAAGFALAGSAAAQAPTPASTAGTPAKAKKPKKICRERGSAGSRLSNMVCKTPEEWAQLQTDFDDQDEYGIPGNKVATGRATNVGGTNKASGPN